MSAESILSGITEADIRAMDPGEQARMIVALQKLPAAPTSRRDSLKSLSRPTPKLFIREILGEEPSEAALSLGIDVPWTEDQGLIYDAAASDLPEHRNIAVYSGNGTGKSSAVARIALWALYHEEDTIVVTTAPNARQVEELLWGNIRVIRGRSRTDLPAQKALLTKLEIAPGWHASGFTARVRKGDSTATGFQGIHGLGKKRSRVWVLVDEATDIPLEVWEAIKRITVGEVDRVIAIGNPTDPAAYFCTLRELKRPDGSPMWHSIVISGENHPNVLHGNPDIIPNAITARFIEDILHESGSRDSNVYRSAVLGLPPTESPDTLIALPWFTRAQTRYEEVMERGGPKVDRRGVALGLDVAGEGIDLTVLSKIENGVWELPKLEGRRAWHQGRDTEECVELVLEGLRSIPNVRVICLDDTAIGSAVRARLKALQREKKLPRYRTTDNKERDIWILPVNFARSTDNPKFRTLKDECWWVLREALRDTTDLAIPTEQDMKAWELPKRNSLRAQITAPIYRRVGQGAIEVYDKRNAHGKTELTKNLPAKSPDLAHSFMLAHYGWSKLRADKAARPIPRNFQEAFDAKTQELIDKAQQQERRQKRERGRGRTGPMSPIQRRR